MYRNRLTALAAVLAIGSAGCAVQAAQAHDVGDRGRSDTAPNAPNVVDIVVTGHALELPETIASGWTTFRLKNRSTDVHFGVLELMPDGRTVEDSIAEVVPVFQDGLDRINAGDPNAFDAFGNLPAWYFDVIFMGGPGLVAPGETAETTVFLEPGTYVMECYVITDGDFHSSHGMLEGFEVTAEDSGAPEPTADLEVTVSSDGSSGDIQIDGEIRPGKQTIAVHFADQTVHGNFLGHDLHIARIDDESQTEDLETWMSWITGLETPAPAHFIGGTHEMPAGSTAYIDVVLKPGTYVLVSEVDAPQAKGLLETITVP